jgi:NO-binding membrane sensor protein with MHYT domain
MRRREVKMTVPHEQWRVALSIGIAIQGSFVGLSLASGCGANLPP